MCIRDRDLFNSILKTGVVPKCWNVGIMFLLHKKEDKTDLKNYRGITINPNMSKLFSRILESRLMKVVEENKLLGEFQGAGRKGRHTTDNIFILSTLLEKAKKLGWLDTSIAFVDMKKAFDMVDREKLWALLQKKGLGGSFLRVIKSMYDDNKVFVDINGERTRPINPERGIKQGCVLSPVLFALYLNDLGEELQKSKLGIKLRNNVISCLFFADDICLIGKDRESLFTLLNKTQDYSDKYGLEINPKKGKSEVLSFNKDIHDWPIRNCEGSLVASLNQALQYKYLGIPITLQGNKVFAPRVKDIIVAGSQHTGRIKSLSKDSFNRLDVGEALWQNVSLMALLYGSECLCMTKDELQKLEGSQRGLAKWLMGHDRNAAGVAASTELGWKSIAHLYEERKLLMFARLKYFTSEDRWVREAFEEVQSGSFTSTWWSEVSRLKDSVSLENILEGIPQKSWKKSSVESKIKVALRGKFIKKAKEEIESKSTLNGFPRPSDKDWFKRKGYVNESIGSRMASKIRAGNFGVGNTYMRVKDCILCGKENMNHESHIIMKCKGLDLLRRTTDISEFLLKHHSDDSESGHSALRKYLAVSYTHLTLPTNREV